MPQSMTFTWLDGTQVPWIDDTDEWTSAELREVEALARGEMAQLSLTSVRGLMICVSVARATGQRIAAVDAQLTMGQIRKVRDEIDAQLRENAERDAARLAGQVVPAETPTPGAVVTVTGGLVAPVAIEQANGQEEVLSPTSAGASPSSGGQPA